MDTEAASRRQADAGNGALQGSPHAIQIACGSSHSVALLNSRLVLSWGRGEDGQLGHGDAEERPLPQAVAALNDREIDGVFCGAEYSIAVSSNGQEVYSWGWGDFGRLGHGDIVDVFIPKPISGLSGIGIVTVSCGDTHTLALSGTGQLYSFGRNQNGQLGTGNDEDSLAPAHVEALKDEVVVSIACGAEHSLVCTEDGKVFSWGWGRYGNLGLGDKSDRWSPSRVDDGVDSEKIVRVACGWRHSVLINERGALWTFGWNRYGQLGIGSNIDTPRAAPVHTTDKRPVKQVTCGWRHTVIADEAGVLFAWGWNKFGQLGIGNVEDQMWPVSVVGLPKDDPITHISAGWRHNFAITQNGGVYSWGRGYTGQLGHGPSKDLHVPTLMTELSAATINFQALSTRGDSDTQGASYIPFADRYAVVPDHGTTEAIAAKQTEGEPSGKRHCL